jgi:hypothetical protein
MNQAGSEPISSEWEVCHEAVHLEVANTPAISSGSAVSPVGRRSARLGVVADRGSDILWNVASA